MPRHAEPRAAGDRAVTGPARGVADQPQRAYEGGVRRGRVGFALIALLAMTPGLHELVEATVHAVAVDPDTESAIVHHQEHEDSERSCSGVFHVCPCHAPSLIGLARVLVEVDEEPPATSEVAPPESFARGRAGYRSSIFRPPIA